MSHGGGDQGARETEGLASGGGVLRELFGQFLYIYVYIDLGIQGHT